MKITCSKKDDILKQKAEYDAKQSAYEQKEKAIRKQWDEDHEKVYAPVRDEIASALAKFNLLEFDISVSRGWSDSGLEVRIRCNEYKKFSDDSALSWNYNVKLDENGDVVRETGSWSGLQATTAAQIDSLKQSVGAIEVLYNMDWSTLLNKRLPQRGDYYTKEIYDMRPDKPEVSWEKQLEGAEIEEAIGKDIWYRCSVKDSERDYWYDAWVKFIKATPQRYVVKIANLWKADPDYLLQALSQNPNFGYAQQIAKRNVSLKQPIEKVEVE